jgi:2-polyprenyl-3-methyl-5-hydroxy-6-metoxy-1,4-benzoquinol methylase
MTVMWNRLKYILSPQFDIYEQISKVVRGNVADIGSGTGFGTHLLTVNAKKVLGYEVDKDALRFAEKVFPVKHLSFQYGDIHRGIDDGPYDFVVMVDVIEHLKYDKRALLNVKSMLGKRGQLILSTPNRLSRYRKSENHVKEYAPKELEGLLRKVFTDVSLRNHLLEPLASQYQNPLLAVCRSGM